MKGFIYLCPVLFGSIIVVQFRLVIIINPVIYGQILFLVVFFVVILSDIEGLSHLLIHLGLSSLIILLK